MEKQVVNKGMTTYISSDGTSITLIDYPPFNNSTNFYNIRWGLPGPMYFNHMSIQRKSYKVTGGPINKTIYEGRKTENNK